MSTREGSSRKIRRLGRSCVGRPKHGITSVMVRFAILSLFVLLSLSLSSHSAATVVSSPEQDESSLGSCATTTSTVRPEKNDDVSCDAIPDDDNDNDNATTNNNSQNNSSCPIQGLVDWMRSQEGGFLSEKIEIRRQNPDDPTSPYGVFATQDIEEKETVLKIPRHAYMQLSKEEITVYVPQDGDEDYDDDADMEVYYTNTCRLAKRLLQETASYRNRTTNPADDSSTKHTAFIRYLEETQPKGQLPAAYSTEGKALLRDIQGTWKDTGTEGKGNYAGFALPPWKLVDWIDDEFLEKGCIDAEDEDAYHAVALAIQRGYDTELIPIWDMVNHDNNKLNLDSTSIHNKGGLVVWAKKHIQGGDELYASYNFCTDCLVDGSGDFWGTPGIFRDFGFVEDYPQYWPFVDQDVYALIERNGPGFEARYFTETDEDGLPEINSPDTEDLPFFRDQLARLKSLDVDSQVEELAAPHERFMIRQYYQSLMNAITAIIHTDVDDPLIITNTYP